MQKAQIKKAMDAGTEVAVTGQPGRVFPPYGVRKAVIVAVDAPRRKRSAYYGKGTPVSDGIRIRFADGKTDPTYGFARVVAEFVSDSVDEYEDTDDRVAESRQILSTWAEYEQKLAAHDAVLAAYSTKCDGEQKRQAEQHAACVKACEKLQKAAIPAAVARVGYEWRVVLVPAAAERIVSLVDPKRAG